MKKDSKDLTVINQESEIVVPENNSLDLYFDDAKFAQLWKVSSLFSKSDLVPDHYKGKPENCMISISMAVRVGVDPIMMLQNSYIVHGTPGIEAKLAIALVNASSVFTGPVQYKYKGEGVKRSCTAYATSKHDGEICEQTVSIEMAKANGWWDKKGSKWPVLPDLMLAYRSAMFLARLHCPEVLMGMKTTDELKDVGPKESKNITSESEDLKKKFAPKAENKPEKSEEIEPEEMTEGEAEELEDLDKLGPFALKLAEIIELEEYQTVIQSLLKSKEFLPDALRTKDEERAAPIVELILKTKGFADAAKREEETEEDYFGDE